MHYANHANFAARLCAGCVLPAALLLMLTACGYAVNATGHAAIELPALGSVEREAIAAGNKSKGAPLQTGIGREVPADRQRVVLSTLSWQLQDGMKAARFTVHSPRARSLRVGLRLTGTTDCGRLQLRFGGASGLVGDAVPAIALLRAETWWSPVLKGDTAHVIVELPAGMDPGACALLVPVISHLY